MQKPEEFESCLSKEAAIVVLPPSERLKAHNLAHWFLFAEHARRFCKLCDWPLDPWIGAIGSTPDDRCSCCSNMESALARSQYWRDIEAHENRRRQEMGLK